MATCQLKGSERAPLPNARVLGPTDPQERLEVSVIVRPPARAALEEHVSRLARRPLRWSVVAGSLCIGPWGKCRRPGSGERVRALARAQRRAGACVAVQRSAGVSLASKIALSAGSLLFA